MASDGVSVNIEGLTELKNRLEKFQGNRARRILTRASRMAMKETNKKAKANAKALDDPKTANQIFKNIITKVNSKKFNSQGIITASVGVRGGAKKGGTGPGGDTYYWRYFEFGNSRQQATPFLRPAMDAEQITSAFVSALNVSIDKEIAKYGEPT